MVSFLETLVFPDSIAYGATGGPEYATAIAAGSGGHEARRSTWTAPLHRYELGLAPRTAADTNALVAFFHLVRGRAYAFRFPDFGAGESTGTDEPIGTGTGAVATYQLVKRYTRDATSYDRPIFKPRAGTVTLKDNGAALASSAYSVNYINGIVTTTVTAGHAITASYQFDVPVRFATDRLAIRRIDGGYQWDSIELIEVRDIAAHQSAGVVRYTAEWEYDVDAGLAELYTTVFDY